MFSVEENNKIALHKHIKKVPVVTKTVCACCKNEVTFGQMWSIKRFTENDGEIGIWNYCTNCILDKDDLIIEIIRDNCPFGIYPIDRNKHKAITAFSWVKCDVVDESNYKPKVRGLKRK